MLHVTDKDVKNYLSHPGKKLAQGHTQGVMDRGHELWTDYRGRTARLVHDIGKFINPNFEKKLLGKDVTGLYTNHSYLSFYVVLNYYVNNGLKKGIICTPADLVLVGVCALKHHGSLPNFQQLLNDDEFERMRVFLSSGNYNPPDSFLSFMEFDGSIKSFDLDPNKISKEKIKELFSPKNLRGNKTGKPIVTDPLDFFFDLRMCFSSLVAADKYDAGNIAKTIDEDDRSKKLLKVYDKRVQEYFSSLGTGVKLSDKHVKLNQVRTQIRNECISRLKEEMKIHPDQRVFSLTEPTGSGKTAMLVGGAVEIIKEKKLSSPKTIYLVPFLSITEQVFDIIEGKIFKEEKECVKRIDCKSDPGCEVPEEDDEVTLLKRALSYIRKIVKGQTLREEQIDQVLLMDFMEQTFDFPMIVTTFVQVFQAFTTASNRGLMKFASLQNCVFLADEIQSLPPRLYSFFVAMLDVFCKKFNSYAIVSTATMPCFELPKINTPLAKGARDLFKGYTPPIEIGNLDHFKDPIFNRYQIRPIKEHLTIKTLSERVLKETSPTMVVLNTIRDSREEYVAIKKQADCPVILLNTLFYSEHRTFKLNEVKKLIAKKEKFFLITTSVVEAGVDLDFDVVYRDIAPIPNIVQASGRCNRNCNLAWGIVYVFVLVDDKGFIRARHIYKGKDSLFLEYAYSKLIGSSQLVYEEKDLLDLQRDFFKVVNEETLFGQWDVLEENNFVVQIRDFRYHDIGQFSLISKKEYGDQVQFYVPESKDDRAYEKLLELYAEKASYEANPMGGKDSLRTLLGKIRSITTHRKSMMGRVIQVNLKDETEIAELSEYSSEPIFKLYKLKAGKYDQEFGLMIRNKGDIHV
jgi:CRISPR-associated endonuclease/helicase Cas3